MGRANKIPLRGSFHEKNNNRTEQNGNIPGISERKDISKDPVTKCG